MDGTTPPDLQEILQRSINVAKELQSQLVTLTQAEATSIPWEPLVQAHTTHLLNHNAILKSATSMAESTDAASAATIQAMAVASEQMIKDTRAVHELVLRVQVTKNRGSRPTSNAPTSKATPSKGSSKDEPDEARSAAASQSEALPDSAGQPKRTHEMKDTAATREEAISSSPKRQLEGDEASLAVAKRTKLAPAASHAEKRKSDVSMADAESVLSPSPPSKRHKHQDTEGTPVSFEVEYEDITAEVDARMQQHEERKEREIKQELGITDKRKRQSNDSFTVDLSYEEGADKPSRKRKKHKHQDTAQGSEG